MIRNTFIFFIFLLLGFMSCRNKKPVPQKDCKTLEPKDSANYRYLKAEFYRGKDGKLYEKKIAIDKMDQDTGYCYFAYYESCWNCEDSIPTPLDSIIDIQTFVNLTGSSYSRDKKHVYYFQETSDGGVRYFADGANPNTFRVLHDYRWGIDDKHIFHKGGVVSGINMDTYKLFPPTDKEDCFLEYVRDDKHVFYETDSIPGADPLSFHIQNGEKDEEWDAWDKNHHYRDGKICDK